MTEQEQTNIKLEYCTNQIKRANQNDTPFYDKVLHLLENIKDDLLKTPEGEVWNYSEDDND